MAGTPIADVFVRVRPDLDGFDAELRTKLAGKHPDATATVKVDVDKAAAAAAINDAVTTGTRKAKAKVKVDVDVDQVRQAVAAAGAVAKLDKLHVKALGQNVARDQRAATQAATEAIRAANAVAAVSGRAAAKRSALEARAHAENVTRDRRAAAAAAAATLRAAKDVAAVTGKMDRLHAKAVAENIARDRRVTVTAEVATAKAAAELTALTAKREAHLVVNVDTAHGEAALEELARRARALQHDQAIADLAGGGGRRGGRGGGTGGGAGGGRGRRDGFPDFDLPILSHIPAIQFLFGKLATLALAAAPAVFALGSSLAFASTSALGLIPALTGAVGIVGVLAAALAGPIKSFTEYVKQADTAAVTGVSNAAALRGATEGLSDARRNAARSARDAAEQVAAAQRGERDAQEDLNDARRQAVRDLEDLRDATEDLALDEESAQLRVERAAQRISEAAGESGKDAMRAYTEALDVLDKAQANVATALERSGKNSKAYKTALADLTWAQSKLAAGTKAGTLGSLDQREAVLDLKQAQHDLAGVQRDRARTETDYAEAQRKGVAGADVVVAAQQRLTDAHAAVGKAQRDAAESQADAARAVARATSALADVQATQTATRAKALKANTAESAAFQAQLRAMIPHARALRNESERTTLPGFTRALKAADALFPILKVAVGAFGRVLSDTADSVGKLMRTPLFQTQLRTILASMGRAFGSIGRAIRPTLAALLALSVATAPLVERFARFVEKQAKLFAGFIEGRRRTGELTRFFRDAGDKMAIWGGIVAAFARGLLGMMRGAKTEGDTLATSLRAIGDRFAAWSTSDKGRADVAKFFQTMHDLPYRRILDVAKAAGELYLTYQAFKLAGTITRNPFWWLLATSLIQNPKLVSDMLEALWKAAAPLMTFLAEHPKVFAALVGFFVAARLGPGLGKSWVPLLAGLSTLPIWAMLADHPQMFTGVLLFLGALKTAAVGAGLLESLGLLDKLFGGKGGGVKKLLLQFAGKAGVMNVQAGVVNVGGVGVPGGGGVPGGPVPTGAPAKGKAALSGAFKALAAGAGVEGAIAAAGAGGVLAGLLAGLAAVAVGLYVANKLVPDDPARSAPSKASEALRQTPFAQVTTATPAVQEQLAKYGLQSGDIQAAANGDQEAVDRVAGAVERFNAAVERMPETTARLRTIKQNFRGIAADADALNRQVRLLSGASEAFWNNARTASSTAVTFAKVLDKVGDTVARNGKTLDAHTVAGRANRKMLADGMAAAVAHGKAVEQATGSVEAGRKARDADLVSLRQQAVQYGLNAGQVTALTTTIGRLPVSKKSTLTVNAEQAKRVLAETDRALSNPHLTAEQKAVLSADRSRQVAVLNRANKALQDYVDKEWITHVMLEVAPIIRDPETGRAVGRGVVTGWYAAAEGGLITGAGTRTSDSVPILASRDEWIVRAGAAAGLGTKAMTVINNADRLGPRFTAELLTALPKSTARRLADGGPVSGRYATALSAPGAAAAPVIHVDPPQVRVYIGEREITSAVRVVVTDRENRLATALASGRRRG